MSASDNDIAIYGYGAGQRMAMYGYGTYVEFIGLGGTARKSLVLGGDTNYGET